MSPKCYACGGTGKKTCRICKGSGKIIKKESGEVKKSKKTLPCSLCGGKGVINCSVCGGIGRR